MKTSIYVETSIVSYLTAWPKRDLVLAAHQAVTREWWAKRAAFDFGRQAPAHLDDDS